MSFEDLLRISFFFVTAYTLSFIFTPVVISVARLTGMQAYPGGRHIHATATPTGVGAAPLCAMGITTVIYLLLPGAASDATVFLPDWGRLYLVTLVMLLVLGVADDRCNLRPWVKLAGQVIIAVFVYSKGVGFGSELFGVVISPWLDLLCTVAWLAIIMNAFNLIDGFDGLACGLSAISALGLFGILVLRGQYQESMVVMGLLGCILGFARYNWAPARAFLGDTGSLFIGFSLAFFSLSASVKGVSVVSFWLPILCFGVPLFDTLLAVWRRVARKIVLRLEASPLTSAVTGGDAEHLHHRLVNAGFTPKNMNSVLYLANSLLVLAALVSISVNNSIVLSLGVVLLVLIGAVVVKRTARIELRESSRVVVLACSGDGNPVLARLGYATLDAAALVVLYIVAHAASRMIGLFSEFIHFSFWALALWFCMFVPANSILDTYWTEWKKALSVRRAFARYCIHLMSAFICCGIEYKCMGGSALELTLQGLVFSFGFSMWSTLIRMLPSHLEAIIVSSERDSN
jgi:UDP-GlcNAc:undecaprenyl-phosphate/decaprenyl-phosphate GlcNAc-1-phosphate transferase